MQEITLDGVWKMKYRPVARITAKISERIADKSLQIYCSLTSGRRP